MIRIGLPPPVLPRLRVRWHGTQTWFSRYARSVRANASRAAEATGDWWRHVVASLSLRRSLRARAQARQRELLARFEEKYEDLIDLLCWAAQDGAHTDRDARYRELRAWMRAHYRRVAPKLRPFWADPGRPNAADPFHALFASENVENVINAATGIEDLMRTRLALEAYQDSLHASMRS